MSGMRNFLKNFRSVHTHFDTYLLNANNKCFMTYHFLLSALFCAIPVCIFSTSENASKNWSKTSKFRTFLKFRQNMKTH